MERTNARHYERTIGNIRIGTQSVKVVVTKHGDYRILEDKGITAQEIPDVIESIGSENLMRHWEEAPKFKNPKAKDWRDEIDYRIAIYDVIDEIVLMVGIHPHLNRITILTIISRIDKVEVHDVYGVYRVDSEATKNEIIREIITQPEPPKPKLVLKKIVLTDV
jgi:hypothetical protein